MEVNTASPEQLADLAALEAGAAETMPAPEVAAVPAVDPAESWAMLPAMVGSILCMAMPELKAVYTPDACNAWGAAMVPVADEQGWNADEFLGPKMGLLVASAPFVLGTVFAIKARKAAALPDKQKGNEPGALVADPGAGQKTVIIGAPAVE